MLRRVCTILGLLSAIVLSVLSTASLTPADSSPADSSPADSSPADSSPADSSPAVIDLHVDLAYQVQVHGRRIDDPMARTSPARLRRGRVQMIVQPLFVADGWRLSPEQARTAYEATYQSLREAVRRYGSGVLRLPNAPVAHGGTATLFALEGADGFADDPRALLPWIKRGVCIVGPVHTRSNKLAGSSSDPASAARRLGLTEAGSRLIRFAYEHGALVDIAHASDAAVNDIAAIARSVAKPLVCSHTGMRSLKNIERNISDEQLRWVAKSGGVVGVDLHSGHIGRYAGRRATLGDVVRHLEHAVRVAGINHVAIGSDLDGGIEEPIGADGAATWRRLAAMMQKRGWRPEEVEAVFNRNAQRVLRHCRSVEDTKGLD